MTDLDIQIGPRLDHITDIEPIFFFYIWAAINLANIYVFGLLCCLLNALQERVL